MAAKSTTDDKDQTDSVSTTTNPEKTMTENDGQAENASSDDSEPLDGSAGEDNNGGAITYEKMLEYYLKEPEPTYMPDMIDDIEDIYGEDILYVNGAAMFPDPNPVEIPHDYEETEEDIRCNMILASIVENYLNSDDFKPILQLLHDEVFGEFCPNRFDCLDN